jgi:(2R)-sulfolactate sulfo-lyase subunit beta
MSKVNTKIFGYKRENGRIGVRNHVLILPVDDISNAYGRLQFGEDLDLHFRTIIGTGANPNVAAVVVVGIEDGWTKKIVDGIASTGKPVAGFSIEGKGDIATIQAASYKAKEFVQWASELQRSECDFKDLYISVKCGESDTTTGLSSCPAVGNVLDKHCAEGGTASFGETSELTGAEHIVAAKAADEQVRKDFFAMFEDYTKLVFDQKTNDLSESQPTKGNIAGGLTTIEEKALGNVEKLGKKTKFVGCLPPAVAPTKPGMWFMDTSSAAAEAVTLWAASGAVIHLFPTGQGNVIGNPIEPVIKLTGNPKTVKTMSEHIDVDVSKVLQGEMTIDEAGDALIDMIVRTANGRLTAAESLGHREFSMTKLYRSA